MKNNSTIHRLFLSISVAALGLHAAPPSAAQSDAQVRVTITNLTKGQIISPVVVATHRSDPGLLFGLGEPADSELAQLAEDAVLQPLIDNLNDDSAVMRVRTIPPQMMPSPIMPGHSESVASP